MGWPRPDWFVPHLLHHFREKKHCDSLCKNIWIKKRKPAVMKSTDKSIINWIFTSIWDPQFPAVESTEKWQVLLHCSFCAFSPIEIAVSILCLLYACEMASPSPNLHHCSSQKCWLQHVCVKRTEERTDVSKFCPKCGKEILKLFMFLIWVKLITVKLYVASGAAVIWLKSDLFRTVPLHSTGDFCYYLFIETLLASHWNHVWIQLRWGWLIFFKFMEHCWF